MGTIGQCNDVLHDCPDTCPHNAWTVMMLCLHCLGATASQATDINGMMYLQGQDELAIQLEGTSIQQGG